MGEAASPPQCVCHLLVAMVPRLARFHACRLVLRVPPSFPRRSPEDAKRWGADAPRLQHECLVRQEEKFKGPVPYGGLKLTRRCEAH